MWVSLWFERHPQAQKRMATVRGANCPGIFQPGRKSTGDFNLDGFAIEFFEGIGKTQVFCNVFQNRYEAAMRQEDGIHVLLF